MTYAQIYAEALRLMFATLSDDIGDTAEGMAGLVGNVNYRDYMLSMPGAVNRCFADLEAKKVLPWRTARVGSADGDKVSGGYRRVLLSEIAPDCYEIERVTQRREYGDEAELTAGEDYFIEEDELILIPGATVIRYTPALPRIDAGTDLDAKVPLPELLAAVVPYYVKGELYRQEEPHEAAEAHNLYEQRVAQASPPVRQTRGSVAMVYGFGEDSVW